MLGEVRDARTGEPIADAVAKAGSVEVETDAHGKFVLNQVPEGAKVTVESCAYTPATVSIPVGEGPSLDVELEPLAFVGRVTSNLTGSPVQAAMDGAAKGKTSLKGRFRLFGLCSGDRIRVSAEGYTSQKVEVGTERTVEVVLEAGAGVTASQVTAWEAAGDIDEAWALVHPDALAYSSKKKYSDAVSEDARAGFQTVSIDVKGVTFLTWTFPKCELADFGPKTYRHTAAVDHIAHVSTPQGGGHTERRVTHWVRLDDGLWHWFPNVGCSF